jgi:AcrR family transcriptional regulator
MTTPQNTKWGDKETRRQDILTGAQQQLAQAGYQGLNIRDVARAANVSPGLVYAYFANKEELFATLYAGRLTQLQTEMLAVCATATNADLFFVDLVTAYLPVYQVFGREFNLFSLLRQPEQLPSELTERLTQTALQLMTTIFSHSQRLLAQEGVAISALPQAELVMPMFWIILNGLADHFSGERKNLYGHDLQTMTRFVVSTLRLGLISLANTPLSTSEVMP